MALTADHGLAFAAFSAAIPGADQVKTLFHPKNSFPNNFPFADNYPRP